MRGRRDVLVVTKLDRRLTPAYAGKTSSLEVSVDWQRAHPRVCGEDAAIRRACALTVGSPPRMRGRRIHRGRGRQAPGLTPAYAGKTASPSDSTPAGEGSPPRMRGRRELTFMRADAKRLTPAYAGKTGSLRGVAVRPGLTPAYAGKTTGRSHGRSR